MSEPFEKDDFTIEDLGERTFESPLSYATTTTDDSEAPNELKFTRDPSRTRVPIKNRYRCGEPHEFEQTYTMELAGPRRNIFFDPKKVTAAIVTCGGLCPGLNDIIYSLVNTLWNYYHVHSILGIQYGYLGFLNNAPTLQLTPETVENIYSMGGSFLGAARGGGKQIERIAQRIEVLGINVLFVIGGDGTQKGARDLSNYLKSKGAKVAVVGIPKTIDNDIKLVHKTFGFETAVSVACQAVNAAKVEAISAPNGIGLVKLMGRDSGFIAVHTAIASHDADFVLIPEVPFDLKGSKGLYATIQRRLEDKGHAVIIVAEGAGQEHFAADEERETDKGGNLLYNDIGLLLKDGINEHFSQQNITVNLKYIDPSYMIRAARPVASDAYYCARLGNYAVHAAMAGKTSMLISSWNSTYVHIPISVAVTERDKISPGSTLWRQAVETTGQPLRMKN